jgi:hypothetical protein
MIAWNGDFGGTPQHLLYVTDFTIGPVTRRSKRKFKVKSGNSVPMGRLLKKVVIVAGVALKVAGQAAVAEAGVLFQNALPRRRSSW